MRFYVLHSKFNNSNKKASTDSSIIKSLYRFTAIAGISQVNQTKNGNDSSKDTHR